MKVLKKYQLRRRVSLLERDNTCIFCSPLCKVFLPCTSDFFKIEQLCTHFRGPEEIYCIYIDGDFSAFIGGARLQGPFTCFQTKCGRLVVTICSPFVKHNKKYDQHYFFRWEQQWQQHQKFRNTISLMSS